MRGAPTHESPIHPRSLHNGSFPRLAGISHPYQSPRALSLLPSRPWLANALALLLLRWNITFELVSGGSCLGEFGKREGR